jgi:L-alanine-DL-glutamate epimerase-like enolase superfamily enzyme
MRIGSVIAYRIRIPFKMAFAHTLQHRRATEAVILIVKSDTGHIGVGEVLPRPYLTGETIESVSQLAIPTLVQRWLGRRLANREDVVEALREELQCSGRALATFAGWELAMLDLAGKVFSFAAGDVLGLETKPDLPPGVVIDFAVPTHRLERHCMLLRLAGRSHVKVKVGLHDDLHRLSLIQGVFGADHPLRLDANAAWTADYAIPVLRQMRRFNVLSVEQPVPARDLHGMRRVREESGMAVVADESLCSLEDAQSLTAAHAADVFNIRIGKCGGFLGSLRLVQFANEAGLRYQLGTLVGETGILSRAAEIFGRRVPGFDFLEGKHQNKTLLLEDIVEVTLPEENTPTKGLGIIMESNCLDRWAASLPTIFREPQRRLA